MINTVYILEYARPLRIPLIFWSTNRVYGTDRVNAPPWRKTATNYEYDLGDCNRLSLDLRPVDLHPVAAAFKGFFTA